MTIRVAIVEDHAPTRELWVAVLEKAAGFECVGRFRNTESAIDCLPTLAPEVVLVDINLPGLSGIECVRKLKLRMPDTQFLMVTAYEDADNIFDALAAGAAGYLLKGSSHKELLDAIREVRTGGSPMTSSIARKVVQSFQPKESPAPPESVLSPRECEVLDLLAAGDLYKEIAETLGISLPTVSTYVRRIYEKLHVRSRAQAVARYAGRQRPPQS